MSLPEKLSIAHVLGSLHVGGGERALTTGAAVPPDQAGNLSAMAASIPGIQLIPGMDGASDMFSALGLSGDQNNTNFNGLGSGLNTLPPDAQVRLELVDEFLRDKGVVS